MNTFLFSKWVTCTLIHVKRQPSLECFRKKGGKIGIEINNRSWMFKTFLPEECIRRFEAFDLRCVCKTCICCLLNACIVIGVCRAAELQCIQNTTSTELKPMWFLLNSLCVWMCLWACNRVCARVFATCINVLVVNRNWKGTRRHV